MDRKKAIVISLSASFIIMTTLFCYFYFRESKINNTSNQNQTTSKTVNKLPVDNIDKMSSSSDNDYYVKDLKNKEEIKKAFDKYLNSDNKDELSWNKIINDKKQWTSVDDFSSAVGIKINDKVGNLLKKDEYYMISCSSAENGRDYGIGITVRLFDNYQNLFADKISFLKNWERSMLSDLQGVIFPKTKFSQAELNKELDFEGDLRLDQYRSAKINDSSSIYYNIVDDYILVTSSKACMDKITSDLIGG